MSKAEDRKTLQRMLANLRADLRDIEKFAAEKQLEFSFMGMKYFLKDPGGSNRYAPKGIFINEGEWQSSTWGCTDSEASEKFDAWENRYFPPDDEDDDD